MQDLEQMRRELQRQGKLDALRALSQSPEAAALQQRITPEQMKDPETMKQALAALLQSREGQTLAKKIRDAMDHG